VVQTPYRRTTTQGIELPKAPRLLYVSYTVVATVMCVTGLT